MSPQNTYAMKDVRDAPDLRLLALPDVDDVVADLREVDMQRRGPGELNTARAKLHDQGLARSARDV